MMGDFNTDCNNKSINSRKRINLLISYGFRLQNSETTHDTLHCASTMDLIFFYSARFDVDAVRTIPIDF